MPDLTCGALYSKPGALASIFVVREKVGVFFGRWAIARM
jgi:hypothetical protein